MVILVGSRFLHGAEQRYAPIEGEALAIAWGLEQTKYFTQACDNLLVVTDHKSLVKILGDRTLDEITNTRLFRLKQRTLPWRFEIEHMPGNTNKAADATSRYPSPSTYTEVECLDLSSTKDKAECDLNAAIAREATDLTSISWQEISTETMLDPTLSLLVPKMKEGFPSDFKELEDCLSPFWNIRESLYVGSQDVVMHGDRVVIPLSLQARVLQILHSAHQGTSGMEARAQALLFWPGICSDSKQTREECLLCCKNAPSQSSTPTAPPDIPSTPFESIFADFFYISNYHYLVAGDRLSGWVEVFSAKVGTKNAGSSGLIAHLRSMFATFGVPITLSSDGGPEFTAFTTSEFLKRWGVHPRISSAHFPQ